MSARLKRFVRSERSGKVDEFRSVATVGVAMASKVGTVGKVDKVLMKLPRHVVSVSW
jgi:hypothetical protein